jgi:hypothetical protein
VSSLWIGDPGARDAHDDQRATYVGPAKAFCPCDTGNPQDCKPEEWRPAHSPRPPCERCGAALYAHQGNYCRRPTPWAPRDDTDWIWHSLINRTPWTPQAVDVVRKALAAYYAIPNTMETP